MAAASPALATSEVEGVEADGPKASSEAWKQALASVVPCCVVLKVTLTRAFDTEPATSAYATGFIVDKQRGIILTNRHVVTPGPIVAEAIFLNREELPVYPIYYDAVHDFAFLRFDPSRVQYLEVNEVPLAPEAAAVGLDIRVIGNDSGEKISILAGTLARLDRDAPVYGRKGYNDFNTFYLQAASGTKGGSSGSPVVDCHGRAVALNAGGKNKAASAYYLPLQRVVRALKLIQAGKDAAPGSAWPAPVIPRGDLQTTFLFKGFDEVRRLGLKQETERAVRNAHTAPASSGGEELATGMLVAENVVPGSPADGIIEAGDVLVSVNGQVVTDFLCLEEVLDEAVASSSTPTVQLELERGGQTVSATLAVTNLHKVTPAAFLEVSGGSVHALSYQQARNNRAVVGQVYVAEPGYMLARANVPRHAIITAVAGKPTPDLESFRDALRTLPHGSRTPLEYLTFAERHRRKNVILHVDRQWYGPPILWQRDDAAGVWQPTVDFTPTNSVAEWPLAPAHGSAADTEPSANGHAAGAEAKGAEPATEAHSKRAPREEPSRMASGVSAMEGSVGSHMLTHGTAAAAAAAALARGANADGHTANCTATSAVIHAMEVDGGEEVTKVMGGGQKDEGEDLDELMRCCLVLVDVDIPLVALTDGVHARSFAGNGLVVYMSDRVGLVLMDRNTVVVGPCDVNLSFGAHPAEIAGRVRFLHPLHNFAIVSFDPQDLPAEARVKVRAAELYSSPPLKRGDTVQLQGLTKHLRVMRRASTVINATFAVNIGSAEVPRFRAVHEEVIKLDQDFGASFSGCLTDNRGRVRAMWGSYAEQSEGTEREWCSGLHTHVFQPWVQLLVKQLDEPAGGGSKAPPTVCTLDAELEAVLLAKAAQFGLPAEWISRLDRLDPERRQVLRVRSCVAQSHAAQVLRSGDMILAINGRPVSCFQDVERLMIEAAAAASKTQQEVQQAQAPAHAATGATSNGAVGGVPTAGKKTPLQDAAAKESPAKRPRRNSHCGGAAAAVGDGGVESTLTIDATAGTAAAMAARSSPDNEVTGPCTVHVYADGADDDGGAGAAAPSCGPVLPTTIFRSGAVLDVDVVLGCEDSMGTGRLVHWCGAQLQAPHRAVRELGFVPAGASGVYISRWHHGSPAHRYGLYALHFIMNVNGVDTPDLDTFLEVVKGCKDGEFVRIKVCHLETTQPKVLTVKLDLKYWPTWELRLDNASCTWRRHQISVFPHPA